MLFIIIFLFSMSYLFTAKITPEVAKFDFYMVWKSYCWWFPVCLTQILVLDYSLN